MAPRISLWIEREDRPSEGLVSAVPAQPIRIPAQARTNGSGRNVAISLESPPIAVAARNLGICAPLIAAAVPRGDEAEFRREFVANYVPTQKVLLARAAVAER